MKKGDGGQAGKEGGKEKEAWNQRKREEEGFRFSFIRLSGNSSIIQISTSRRLYGR